MRPDLTTLRDLSIFSSSGEDVFHLLDLTATSQGRQALRRIVQEPYGNLQQLQAAQEVTRWWIANPDAWSAQITNGTLVMLEKFYESSDVAPLPATGISLVLGAFFQRVFNRNQYSFVQFSLGHLTDFIAGTTTLLERIRQATPPQRLAALVAEMQTLLEHPLVDELRKVDKRTPFPTLSRLAHRARRELKLPAQRLMDAFGLLDAWHALAVATVSNKWTMPQLEPGDTPVLECQALYHPLLQTPVPYDVHFDAGRNFLLLTGANMSGKTTFMRALGVAALLAHIGCGVPAVSAKTSFLKGIITNMHVEDNILRGESYFFAEVKRIRQTAVQLNTEAPYLVLMDELFKGTNVQDAYDCTRAVVEGLLSRPRHLLVLSTHLHEVAHLFESRSEVQFAYFQILPEEEGYRFTYELRPGISEDRIGYQILKDAGVLRLLQGTNV